MNTTIAKQIFTPEKQDRRWTDAGVIQTSRCTCHVCGWEGHGEQYCPWCNTLVGSGNANFAGNWQTR
jgi:hypothetical protein